MDRGFQHDRTGSLLCPAGMDWSDDEYVVPTFPAQCRTHLNRIKAKLRSGDMAVPGDHWPIFLYTGYIYDPEDPWKGLFRSSILVAVSAFFFFTERLTAILIGL